MSTTTSAARIARDLGARPTGPRYELLMLATILSVAVQGIVEPGGPQQVAVTALAGAALLLAFRAADLAPRLVAVGAALAIVVVALSVVRAAVGGIGDGVARTMNAALGALGPPAVAIGIVGDLRSSGQVRLHRPLRRRPLLPRRRPGDRVALSVLQLRDADDSRIRRPRRAH